MHVNAIPKLILQNPYRILGVYANSTKKDIIANKGKATAFLKVNRPVEYPLDLKGILPPLERTLDSMNEADAHLAIAKEQIKYAQFWFLKITPLDDVAFNHLITGNMATAMDIWSKQETLSSLQNKLVCYLIDNEPESAIEVAEILYEKFGDIYISKIDANSTLQMTGTELLHQFIDSLGEEIGMQELLDYKLSPDTKDYIGNKTIGPLISKISSEVEKTKKVDHKDPDARIEAARKLVTNTRDLLSQLKEILSVNDPQYQMIADKLGLEILQCGIDYFNNSEEEGRHQTAMKMQKYAKSIVVGSLAKQRCKENVKILQELIDKLPPKEIKTEHENLQEAIALFVILPIDVDAILEFLNNTCQDLVSIKEKLGKDNPYYIQQATLVAQIALSKSIDALNEAQEDEFPKLNGDDRDDAIKTLKHVFASSWKIILWIELIETDKNFKETRLKPNKEVLEKILNEIDALAYKSRGLAGVLASVYGTRRSVFWGCASDVSVDKYMYYTEDEVYEACTSIEVCQYYIEKYEYGKYSKDVHQKLFKLEDDQCYSKSKTIHDLDDYMRKYPNGRHIDEAKTKRNQLLEEQKKKWEKEVNELLRQVESCRNLRDCIALIPKCIKLKSNKLNTRLDDKFYSLCNNKSDYECYIEKMGNIAHHAKEAQEEIQNREVKKWFFIVAVIFIIIILLNL